MNKKSAFDHTNLKATPHRLQVLEVLHGSDAPLAARDVWQRLPGGIGFATVYRALSALCDAGLARKILSESKALYESAPEDHMPQLICSRCGQVEEITDPSLLRYNANVLRKRGLDDHHSLLMYADCRRKECDNK